MFRTLSIIGFVGTFVGIAVCCIASPCKGCGWRPGQILRRLVHLFTMLFVEQRLSLVGVLRKLVYLLALLCFVILAVNGFFAAVVLQKSISGYWIMLQTTAGGVFAVCLAVLVVMWASHCRFTGSDWPWLHRLIRRVIGAKTVSEKTGGTRSGLGQKITFWLIVVIALPLIISIVSSMFTLFGTYWQELLLDTHRYSALALAPAAIVHTYLMIRTQMKESRTYFGS